MLFCVYSLLAKTQRFDVLGLQVVEIIIFVKILLKISESNSRLKGFRALALRLKRYRLRDFVTLYVRAVSDHHKIENFFLYARGHFFNPFFLCVMKLYNIYDYLRWCSSPAPPKPLDISILFDGVHL